MALDPFSLLSSAALGAAGGVAREVQPELQKAEELAHSAEQQANRAVGQAAANGAAAPPVNRLRRPVAPLSFLHHEPPRWSPGKLAVAAVAGIGALGVGVLVGRHFFRGGAT